MRIRTPLGLMLLSQPDGVRLHDPGGSRAWHVDAVEAVELTNLLAWCACWRDVRDVERMLSSATGSSPEDAHATIVDLLDKGLIVSDASRDYAYLGDRDSSWTSRGWREALEFHFHTNLLPKTDYSADPEGIADKALMSAYLAREPQPPAYKKTAGRRIALEREPRVSGASAGVVFADTVGTARARGPLAFAELSWLLRLTYGQTATRKLPLTGAHVAKTSPSGGSRHPTEVYPIVLRASTNVEPGLYHYSVEEHALVEMLPGDHRQFVQEHVLTHPSRPSFAPTVVFVHTTIFERSMFRYRESRSYRVMQYDLGHLMQTSALVASALGRSSYRAYTLHEDAVERFLGIDGIVESAMTFTAVG